MNKKKKSWFDEHVIVLGCDDKTNEIIKQKLKKEVETQKRREDKDA
tara:strand:+ start:716 stop:853 length:138 start_codon:yes stop_codon:yes gene_type:complete